MGVPKGTCREIALSDLPQQTQDRVDLMAAHSVATPEQPHNVLKSHTFGASLWGFGSTDAIACRASNLSEDEVYVHAPPSSGIAVGQRYEVRLSDSGQAPKDVACALAGGCFATVVRTDLPKASPQHELGAGLRFDRPLAL